MRRLLALWLLGGALVLWLRRLRASGRTEAVRLFYADGSSVTLEPGAPGAERLVALARRAL